jgi:hypothetical protein
MNPAPIVQKLWNYCNLLRDDGMGYGDYVEQLNRHDRQATWSADINAAAGTGPEGCWRAYGYADLMARDKASLDIFWLQDDALADSDNLPPPDVIAQEIVDDLEAALEQFRLIAGGLAGRERCGCTMTAPQQSVSPMRCRPEEMPSPGLTSLLKTANHRGAQA